jgi:hypothetical protein
LDRAKTYKRSENNNSIPAAFYDTKTRHIRIKRSYS